MVNKLAVGTTDPEDIDPEVIELTDLSDKPDAMTEAEYVAQVLNDHIAVYEPRGYEIRQAVTPSVDRFQDPDEVNPVVDFSR